MLQYEISFLLLVIIIWLRVRNANCKIESRLSWATPFQLRNRKGIFSQFSSDVCMSILIDPKIHKPPSLCIAQGVLMSKRVQFSNMCNFYQEESRRLRQLKLDWKNFTFFVRNFFSSASSSCVENVFSQAKFLVSLSFASFCPSTRCIYL